MGVVGSLPMRAAQIATGGLALTVAASFAYRAVRFVASSGHPGASDVVGLVMLSAGLLTWAAIFTAALGEPRGRLQQAPNLASILVVSGFLCIARRALPFLTLRAFVGFLCLMLLTALFSAVRYHGASAAQHDPHDGDWPGRTVLALLALSVGVFLLLAEPVFRLLRFEDIFITMRYGHNLASGHGLRWNPQDELPTEGYTTALWVLLSAVFSKLGLDLLPFLRLAAGASLALLIAGTTLSCRVLWRVPWAASFLPAALLLLLPQTPYHVATGMETAFFAASTAGMSLTCLMWWREPSRRRWPFLFGAALTVAGLTRPEAALYAGALIAVGLLCVSSRWTTGSVLAFAMSGVVPGIAYVIWRLMYFGHVWPNSLLHKQSGASVWSFAVSDVMFTDFVMAIAFPFLQLAMTGLLMRRWSRDVLFFVVPPVVCIVYYSWVLPVGGNHFRFFWPFLWALVVAASADILSLWRACSHALGAITGGLVAIAATALVVAAPQSGLYGRRVGEFGEGRPFDERQEYYMRAARVLELLPKDAVIGIGEVGKIGWILRDRTLVDIVGLNDEHLARNPFGGEYLDKRRVEVIVPPAYPRAARGLYATVYRSVGEAFPDIERRFLCVGGIDDSMYFDVFVRRHGALPPDEYAERLAQNPDFELGHCRSTTAALWTPPVGEKLELGTFAHPNSDVGAALTSNSLSVQPRGPDPILRSRSLHLDAGRFRGMVVEFVADAAIECPTFSVYFTTVTDPVEDDNKAVMLPFLPAGEPQRLFFDFSQNPRWTGTASSLRLDPVCAANTRRPGRDHLDIRSLGLVRADWSHVAEGLTPLNVAADTPRP